MREFLIFLSQLFILWMIHSISTYLTKLFSLPIPGNVLGMIILFLLLWSGILKLAWINKAASFLLQHLVFFFIPITVGIMTLGEAIINKGLILLTILLCSGALGFIMTGKVAQSFLKKR